MRAYLKTRGDVAGYEAVADAVKAVETVAASNIQRSRNAALSQSAYISAVSGILAAFRRHHSFEDSRLTRPRAAGDRVLMILSSDRGMVGGLYSRVVATAQQIAGDYDRLVSVGEKATKHARDEGLELSAALAGIPDRAQTEEIEALSGQAVHEFLEGGWRSVDILYPRFASLAVQEPTVVPFLPFHFTAAPDAPPEGPLGLPILDPSGNAVADELLARFAALYFHSIAAEAKLSEFAARTLAMEQAGNKARQRIEQVKLRYFKERRRDFSRKQIESFFAHRAL